MAQDKRYFKEYTRWKLAMIDDACTYRTGMIETEIELAKDDNEYIMFLTGIIMK